MPRPKLFLSLLITGVVTVAFLFAEKHEQKDERFIDYVSDPKAEDIRFFWKDENGSKFSSIQNLLARLNKNQQQLLFAMNGGMYKTDHSPQGLYIEKKQILSTLDTLTGNGNFYLKPNGIFYLTTGKLAVISTTENFVYNKNIEYATQSGPMLVINGAIHPAFKKGSSNLNIRNGVGILPGNKIAFAMSKTAVSFYDFANHFKRLGCKDALYLDGLVSRTYLPAKNWIQTDGDFGVIIGITKIHR